MRFSFIVWLILCSQVQAQVSPTERSLFSVGLSAHRGFIFAHSKDVQNTDGSYPWGIQLDLNWHKRNQKTWDECYCYPRTGFQIQYFNYDNSILGHSVHANAYIEPYFNFNQRIQLSLKGMAGIAFLTHPFHPQRNPTNMSYSLPISGFVALGIGAHARVSNRINVHAYANYNHISNGGIKDPNKGINWPTVSLGFDYAIEDIAFPQREKTNNKNYKNKPLRYDVGLYFSSKTVKAGEKARWPIYGLFALASKQVSMINALSAGTEIWIDHALEERLKRDGLNDSYVRSGLVLGNEFLMGRFVLSQQIGMYLYSPTEYFDALYQRYGLVYRATPHSGLGVNVLAHRQVANFLDFRYVYTW
ncbi:MAG: acyloxyacyl hydrolase [Bacteroidota bacterium]|jgi:hypothetical protein